MIYRIWLIFCLVVAFVQPISAHPNDEFVHIQKLHLLDEVVVMEWELRPGALVSQLLVQQVDMTNDGIMSQAEIEGWIDQQIRLIKATIDDQPLADWQLHSVIAPANPATLFAGKQGIQVIASATYPSVAMKVGSHEFRIESFFEGDNWWVIFDQNTQGVADFQAADQIMITQSFHVVWDALIQFERTENTAMIINQHENKQPSLPAVPHRTGTIGDFGELLNTDNQSTAFYMIAILTAFILGSFHALTPGHGKTVVAAYLVGTGGTTKQAFLLGLITTITHTGSVLFIGLLVLLASQFFMPETIFPVLELLSGGLIVILGIQLLRQRLQDMSGAINSKVPINNNRQHDDGRNHTHGISFNSLAALGISGGLVPCPDAIAILLLAIAIQRIMLGLLLIISFSVGLAVILIIIGLLMVHSTQWLNRFEGMSQLGRYMPLVSSVIVIMLGVGIIGRQFIYA